MAIAQIQFRRGTTAEWAAAGTVLSVGEPGLDTTVDRWKLGDGVTSFAGLPWAANSQAEVARLEAAADALEGATTPTDAVMALAIETPGTQTNTKLTEAIAGAVPTAAAEAMGNPESDLNVATVALIEEFGGGATTSLRIVRESLTNLGAARPEGAEPVIWLRPSDNLAQPTHFVPETDFIAAASVTPYTPPDLSEIFGAALVNWWDPRLTPPADAADYGTLYDRATTPHNMVPLVTGMTDVPQYDADGINGKPAVYQPAISAMGVSGLALGTGALTVIVGVLMGAADGAAQYVTNGQNSGTATFSIATNTAGDSWLIRRGGTARAAGSMVGGRSVPHALVAMYNGDSSAFWDNGTKTAGILTPGTTAPTGFKLGLKQEIASGDLAPAPGARFFVAGIVNRAVTDDEAALATAYVEHLMGVS